MHVPLTTRNTSGCPCTLHTLFATSWSRPRPRLERTAKRCPPGPAGEWSRGSPRARSPTLTFFTFTSTLVRTAAQQRVLSSRTVTRVNTLALGGKPRPHEHGCTTGLPGERDAESAQRPLNGPLGSRPSQIVITLRSLRTLGRLTATLLSLLLG